MTSITPEEPAPPPSQPSLFPAQLSIPFSLFGSNRSRGLVFRLAAIDNTDRPVGVNIAVFEILPDFNKEDFDLRR